MSPEVVDYYRRALGLFAEAIADYREHEREFGSDQSGKIAECRASIAEIVRDCPGLAVEARRLNRVDGVRRPKS